MKKLITICAPNLVVFGLLLVFTVTDVCYGKAWYWDVNNVSNNNLIKWSKDFSLPAKQEPNTCRVRRLNVNTGEWTDESNKWEEKVTQPKTGSFHVNIEIKGANPVPKGTTLRFEVGFNTDDVGFGGQDLKFQPDPCPKRALKKSIDVGKGRFHAEIDNAVFYGGDTGQSIPELGLNIPANTYAYLYQVNGVEGPNPLTSLRLSNVSFYTFRELGFSHDGSVTWDYLTDEFSEPGTGVPDTSIALFDGLGAAGIGSSSWGQDGDDFVANYASLSAGQSSNILVGFSSLGPGMPGDQYNAFVNDGGEPVGNLVWTPVPEPATIGLLGLGALSLLRRKR